MYTEKEYLKRTLDLTKSPKAENKNAILYVNSETCKQCLVLKQDMLDKNKEISWLKNEVCDFCYDFYTNLSFASKTDSKKFAKAAAYFDRQAFVDKSAEQIYKESERIASTLGIVSEQQVEMAL